jgi:hypothetical protein
MINHLLVQAGRLVKTVQDIYGDQVVSSSTEIRLKFRELTEIDRGTNIESIDTADAIVWVDASQEVAEGGLIAIEGKYYRIEKIVKARNFQSPNIRFKKLFVKKYNVEDAS